MASVPEPASGYTLRAASPGRRGLWKELLPWLGSKFENLPVLEALTEAEKALIFGAGRCPRRLTVEALEGRQMMAANLQATFSDGLLRVEGTPGRIRLRCSRLAIRSLWTTLHPERRSTASAQIAAQSVERIEVYGLAGDDKITLAGISLPGVAVVCPGRPDRRRRGKRQYRRFGDGRQNLRRPGR